MRLVWEQEDGCESETDKQIPKLGKKAPACLECIGTVLSLLDRMASCWWVCQRGDHLIEYLCGRVASNARASVRLLRFGFYDESLLLSRAMGETANLLQLFYKDASALKRWKLSSRQERINKFLPVKVRCQLENLQTPPVINKERYKLLCERAAHIQPETRPQSHNILDVPVAGASLQEEGLLVCLNELALPLSMTALFGVLLLDLEKDIRERVISAVRDLVEQIGGATITEIDDYHSEVLKDPVASEKLAFIAGTIRQLQSERRRYPFRRKGS